MDAISAEGFTDIDIGKFTVNYNVNLLSTVMCY